MNVPHKTLYKNIKVTILTQSHIAHLGAGDWIQAAKTYAAMKDIGVNVEHLLYNDHDHRYKSIKSYDVIDIEHLTDTANVVHLIPGRMTPRIKRWYDKLISKPLLVGSTIFWKSRTHNKIVAQNLRSIGRDKSWIKECTKRLLKHKSRILYGFDLLLSNSYREIENVRANCIISPETVFASIPNGIDEIPCWVREIYKPVLDFDYILYPGVFSPRKNQIGFLRAMQSTDYKIVFMGGPLSNDSSMRYYNECRRIASVNSIFMGHISHGSPMFYNLLKHARVACLASSCETPGIAMLEAAVLGTRVAMTCEGSGAEYLGFTAEYFNPLSAADTVNAVQRAWNRGGMSNAEINSVNYLTWKYVAERTVESYLDVSRAG